MKYLICILCTFSSSLMAQNYFPFPDSNATWYVGNFQKEGSGSHTYKIEGDTILNGNSYHKLIDPYYNSFYGGIREDSFKKIYFYGSFSHVQYQSNYYIDSIGEYLLYQFGLNVGDTIPIFKVNPSEPPRTILSIDSVQVDGVYRLRYNVYSPYILGDDYWIEGIGSSAGLLGTYANEFENEWMLGCFEQNEKYIWPNIDRRCPPVSIKIIKNEVEINVYPNPSQNILHIETKSEKYQVQSIQIIDLNGKTVLRSKQSPIYTTELSSGIYFYQVEMSNGKVSRGKFVKQ